MSSNGDCLGYRPMDTGGYVWLSYQEVLDQALQLGSALVNIGLKPGAQNLYLRSFRGDLLFHGHISCLYHIAIIFFGLRFLLNKAKTYITCNSFKNNPTK